MKGEKVRAATDISFKRDAVFTGSPPEDPVQVIGRDGRETKLTHKRRG